MTAPAVTNFSATPVTTTVAALPLSNCPVLVVISTFETVKLPGSVVTVNGSGSETCVFASIFGIKIASNKLFDDDAWQKYGGILVGSLMQ